ncbi:hypothetical protein MPSEU_000374800 [Mayamaea pseudoterrestris]|nr:hypothetical protein MPSEU_000374800 [Mayamaea pseudoterrestris]
MEEVDRISLEVTLSAAMGALAGVGTSLYKGTPMIRTVGRTSLSCALTGTACFGAERCAALAARTFYERNYDSNEWGDVMFSHAMGGLLGGSILGSLYIGKPAHGVVFFVPLMLLFGTGKKLFVDVREEAVNRMTRDREKHN